MSQLNILYLHSHDTGRYVQPYGYAVPTPHLQSFAEQGVVFRQAFCANPTCSASRAALLTGSYPHTNGMLGLAHRGARLRDYRQHLANFLGAHGYTTALSGAQHEIDAKERHLLGYGQFLHDNPPADCKGHLAFNELNAARAAEFLATVDRARPFFLACGFGLTHRLGRGKQWHTENPPRGDPRFVRPPAPLPDTPETRRDFADFAVAAAQLDRCMGLVLDALQRAGLADSTLVILTTDHGIAFPFMKCNLTDHGLGVMLMMRGPGSFSGGKVVDALVSHVDVFPTICELAGIPKPDWLQGRSLVPLLNGSAAIREEVFAEVNWHAAVEPMRAVRTARYKYIRRFDGRTRPVLPNCDDSPSKTEMLRLGWASRPLAGESLYDLVFDPHEASNLAAEPSCAGVLADMRARLDRWMRETDDPLLSGRMDPWPGQSTNPVDDPSPQTEARPAEPFVVGEDQRNVKPVARGL